MLSLSGRGRVQDVRPDVDDDGDLEGVGVIVEADDVHLPSAGVRIYLHWLCGDESARAWMGLH